MGSTFISSERKQETRSGGESNRTKGESGGERTFSNGEGKQETRSGGGEGDRSAILEPVGKMQTEHYDEGRGGGGENKQQGGGAGVLQAIGETIVEIGQTTKDLMTGSDDQTPSYGDRESESTGTQKKSYHHDTK